MKPEIIDIRGLLPTARPEWQKKRKIGAITKIAVHYDAEFRPAKYDPLVRLQNQARYHISKVWGEDSHGRPIQGFGLMYHLCIAGDGSIRWTQPFELITWQVKDHNPYTLGVKCDMGRDQEPTAAQLKSLHDVLMWLCYERPDFPATRKDVFGHLEFKGNATLCPGKLLPHVVAFRQGKW